MPKVVAILKKVIPGMTFKKATRIMREAHTTGKALVKSCHKELAELYEEPLLAESLTVNIESVGREGPSLPLEYSPSAYKKRSRGTDPA